MAERHGRQSDPGGVVVGQLLQRAVEDRFDQQEVRPQRQVVAVLLDRTDRYDGDPGALRSRGS